MKKNAFLLTLGNVQIDATDKRIITADLQKIEIDKSNHTFPPANPAAYV